MLDGYQGENCSIACPYPFLGKNANGNVIVVKTSVILLKVVQLTLHVLLALIHFIPILDSVNRGRFKVTCNCLMLLFKNTLAWKETLMINLEIREPYI